jgi:hypothetical protein
VIKIFFIHLKVKLFVIEMQLNIQTQTVEMVRLQYFLVLLLVILAYGEDEQHPKPSNIQPLLEYNSINQVYKGVEGHDVYWYENSKQHIKSKLKEPNTKKAKNVIIFVGDGLSLPTIAATRMYLGGEEQSLSFEEFPYYGLVKTYCIDRQVPDSACTATAMLSGIKNNYRGIGVTANVSSSQCNFSDEDVAYSIVKWAQDAGKATGIVTNTRITHATPAGEFKMIMKLIQCSK